MRSRRVVNFGPCLCHASLRVARDLPLSVMSFSNTHLVSLVGMKGGHDAWLAKRSLQMLKARPFATGPLLCRSHPYVRSPLVSGMPSDRQDLSFCLPVYVLGIVVQASAGVQLHLGFRGGPGGGGGFVGEPRNWFINSSTKYFGKDLLSFGPGSSVASPGCSGSFGSRPCL